MRSIEDIRRDHKLYSWDHRYCTMCEQEWPCDTDIVLDALAASEKENDKLDADLREMAER